MPGHPAIGIHDLAVATTQYVLTHETLAAENGSDVAKYHRGIGQRSMSVPGIDEDIVTMAAAAAAPVVARHGADRIRTVVLATETSVDQAKAAGIPVHALLGLPSATRVVELKQACYSGTAALQFAIGLVHRDRSQQVLVIASDVSKYELGSPGEATQGAAAVAMLVGADPALVRIEEPSGTFTADIMDFWRPNYRTTALVDGHESISAYLQAVEGAWKDYTARGGRTLDEFRAFCYHQPFTRMAHKAHRHLLHHCGYDVDEAAISRAVGQTTTYNAVIGNSYTASMYVGLAALLDSADDLTDQAIGFLSYGSGSVAEFFAGTVVPGYRSHLRSDLHREAINRRQDIDYATYRAIHEHSFPVDGGEHPVPRETTGPYRLAGLFGHKRVYEPRQGTGRADPTLSKPAAPGGSMSGTSEVAELYSTIEESARLLNVACSRDRVWAILSAYEEAFGHPGAVVAFRVATALRHVGELDCRFTTHPDDRDPYASALSNGLIAATEHPVGALLADVQERFPVDSYGIDFGVVGGFKKVYAFFKPDDLQEASKLADLPSMPRSLAENVAFFARHGLADRVGVFGIDYASRTVNVYFNNVPAECFEPTTIRSTLREIGMAEPSERMLALGEEAFGLYATLSWDSPRIERICYAAATTDLATLPVPVEPEIEQFVKSVPYGGEDRKFVYGVALTPKGEYYKLESHYKWKPGAMDFI
jgi:hydroxymethylglutaryl-CoA synthase